MVLFSGVFFGSGVFFDSGFLAPCSGILIDFSSFFGAGACGAGLGGAPAGGAEAAAGPPARETRSTTYTGANRGRGSSRGSPKIRKKPKTCRPIDRARVNLQGRDGGPRSKATGLGLIGK